MFPQAIIVYAAYAMLHTHISYRLYETVYLYQCLHLATKSFEVHGGVSIEKFFLEYVIYKDTINLSLINYFKC